MDFSFFKAVVLALLLVDAAMIAITSLSPDPGNFVDSIIKRNSESDNKFLNIEQVTTICNSCIKKGLVETCPHKSGSTPPWFNVQRMSHIKEMMLGDEETFGREAMGIQANTSVSLYFSQQEIFPIKTNIYLPSNTFDYIFTTMDSAAGGNKSRTAIASYVYNIAGPQMILLGIDHTSSRDPDGNDPIIFAHIEHILNLCDFENARMVFCCEKFAYHETQWVNKIKAKFDTNRIIFAKEVKRKKDVREYGMLTDNPLKEKMSWSIRDILHKRNFFIHNQFFTVSKERTGKSMSKTEMIEDLLREFGNIRQEETQTKGVVKVEISGKKLGFDDKYMASLINLRLFLNFCSGDPFYN